MRWIPCALLLLLGPVPAGAEIYRCQGADGKTFFTSDRSACPGAKPHVLKREVQTVLDERSSPALRGARPGSRPASPGGNDGLEAMWRRKRPEAERELEDVDGRVEHMNAVLRVCNRGGEWYQTDESGIRQHVPCNELREKHAELARRREELREYLAEGLEDECRRAGCQPGWVR
jgi:hypothetical protein